MRATKRVRIPVKKLLFVLISLVLACGFLLPGGRAGAGVGPPTPTPLAKQPVRDGTLFPPQILSSPPDGEGPYIHLANYTFDPLRETTPLSLPADLTLTGPPPAQESYYLVQFYGPVRPAWKQAIVDAGAQVFDYVPDFAFIVKMDALTKAEVEAMDEVRWIGLYQPGYRLASALMDADAADETPVDVMVLVFSGTDPAVLADRLPEMGGTVLDVTKTHWKGKVRAEIPRSQIRALAHLAAVQWIEPSPEWELLNNKAADLLGVREVWNTHGLYGAGQTVAVCDTGLDQGSTSPGSLHDDFEDGSGASRVVRIYDRVGDGANDVNSGHGTHVSGSVLGNGDMSGSTPGSHIYPPGAYAGMAPEANLVFQAVENNSTGSLSGIPSDLNLLFNQVVGDGARIHSNSWGSDAAGAYTSSSQEVDEFVWDHKDFTILFSAGNAGIDGNADGVVDLYSMGSPATAKNCVTVGASENNRASGGFNPGGICTTWGTCWPTDFPANPIRDDRLSDDPIGMAAFSSRGPVLDGRFKPDVVGPGTNIASVRSSEASGTGWGALDDNYMYMGGTSMSTPLVAGAAALVREFYTDIEAIAPSAALIKATLINGATDLSPGQYGSGSDQEIPDPPRPNNVEGWGRVNVEDTLFGSAPRELFYDDASSGLDTGEESVYTFQVTDASEPLKVTLAWSDYPGSPPVGGALVNDLDLTVTDPSGVIHYPNWADQRGRLQYLYYDDGIATSAYRWTAGNRVGVRFTPDAYPAILSEAQFLVAATSYPKTFNYYVYDGDTSGPDTLLASGTTTIRQGGWHIVDLAGLGITIHSGDFFLAIRLPDNELAWGYDTSSPIDGRSWDYAGGTWTQWDGNDYMFRATVRGPDHDTSADRVNNVVGIDIDSPAVGSYTVRVHGYNVPQGPQPYALVASGAIVAGSLPSAPTLLAPADGSSTCQHQPTFSWNSVSEATSYRIQVDDTCDFGSPEIDGTITGTSYTPGTPLSDGTYCWHVLASNALGDSDWSDDRSVTLLPLLPPPVLLLPANGSRTIDRTPTLSWNSVSGATGYRIQVDDAPSFASPVIDESTLGSAYTPLTNLLPDTYHWRVSTANTCGGGSWSGAWSVVIDNRPPIPGAGPDRNVGIGASVTLDGSASTDPDGDLPLTFAWTQTGGPPVTLSDPSDQRPTFTAPGTPAVLTFGLIVTDSLGLAAPIPDQVVITVLESTASYVYLPMILK